MNEGTDMKDDSELDSDSGLDVQHASAILQEARERAEGQLRVRTPVLYLTWGLAWLIADGVIWLSVRGQRPYAGPTPIALLTLTLVVAAAAVVAVVIMGRAGSGVGGVSAIQLRLYLLSFVLGFAAVLTLEAALAHAGASRLVLGVYGANAPILMAALLYVASAAIRMSWPVFCLGSWLVIVAAGSGFAGAVNVWGIDALAGGAAFLVMAVIAAPRHRSS
jgi:hypothetical protein